MSIFQNFSDYRAGAWVESGLMIRLEEAIDSVVKTVKKSAKKAAAGAMVTAGVVLGGPANVGAMPNVTIMHSANEYVSAQSSSDLTHEIISSDANSFDRQLDAVLAQSIHFDDTSLDDEIFELAKSAVRATATRGEEDLEKWADRFFANHS